MKNCGEIREDISLYIDDKLGSDERRAFEMHIAKCTACRQEFEEIAQIVELCRNTDEVELPMDFKQKLHERLVTVSGIGVGKTVKKPKNIRFIASIAAGVLLIFLAGSFYSLGLFNPLKAGGSTRNSNVGIEQKSIAGSAESTAPAATSQSKENADMKMKSGNVYSETNRSSQSDGRAIKTPMFSVVADSDTVTDRTTVLTILVDDPEAQSEKVKALALQNGAEEAQKAEKAAVAGTQTDEIKINYMIPNISFDTLKKSLNSNFGKDNVQPGALVSEDLTAKLNALIDKSNNLDSQVNKLEAKNDSQNTDKIDQLKTEKQQTDADIENIRLGSDYTSIALILKKR